MNKKDPDDKIHLNKPLKKEKFKRTFYTYQVTEIKKRMDEGSCPKCGTLKWIKRGTGFQKTWTCDNCGLILTRKDWATKQKWWDFIKLHALDEVKRIKNVKRKSQSVKNYERDGV